MDMKMKLSAICLAILCTATLSATSLLAASPGPAPRFRPMVLPVNFQASAINDRGLLFGDCGVPGQTTPCYYNSNTQQTIMVPQPAGTTFFGHKMNNFGTVVGTSISAVGYRAAFISASGITAINSNQPGIYAADVLGLNDFDVMVGESMNANPCPNCFQGSFAFHPSAPAFLPISQLISTPFNQVDIHLRAVNNLNAVAGSALGVPFFASLASGTPATLLDFTGYSSAGALGMNDQNQIVGTLESGNLNTPVLWKDGVSGTQKTILQMPPGFVVGVATQINNSGLIAGSVYPTATPQVPGKANIWWNLQPFVLDSITTGAGGCSFTGVSAITDSNTLIASGTNGTQQCRAVLVKY